jgi:hypothetical protein
MLSCSHQLSVLVRDMAENRILLEKAVLALVLCWNVVTVNTVFYGGSYRFSSLLKSRKLV